MQGFVKFVVNAGQAVVVYTLGAIGIWGFFAGPAAINGAIASVIGLMLGISGVLTVAGVLAVLVLAGAYLAMHG